MNLGKVEICGAQCQIWDVGGKMNSLWERYYPDCDAFVFVWRCAGGEEADDPKQQQSNNTDDDDYDSDDDRPPILTFAQQLVLLEEVRKSIPDDVPFLIWGHHFPANPVTDKIPGQPKQQSVDAPSATSTTAHHRRDLFYNDPYSTTALLPHYHNPLMHFYFGSARNGSGVRRAMEWLIPVAARQKQFRDKAAADEK